METSVTEVHAYPPRPGGFEEPLFPTRASRLAVAEHLLRAPWLARASELTRPGAGGRTAHARREPVQVRNRRGRLWVTRDRGSGARKRRVVELIDRWREVGLWWDEAARVDRFVLKVLLSCGSVVDLSRERPGGGRPEEWFLVGVED